MSLKSKVNFWQPLTIFIHLNKWCHDNALRNHYVELHTHAFVLVYYDVCIKKTIPLLSVSQNKLTSVLETFAEIVFEFSDMLL